MFLQNFLCKIFSIKFKEIKLLSFSFLFIFLVFASYAILRPIRDSLGLEGGNEELKWLFFGTFIATLLGSLLSMSLSSVVPKKIYLTCIYGFFILNLFLFYIFLWSSSRETFIWISRIFYIWVSIFNLFIISSAWSILTDIFTKDSSKRLFGIITSGASLGSIFGSFLVGVLIKNLGQNNFIILSIIFLFIALILQFLLIKEAIILLPNKEQKKLQQSLLSPVGTKNIFEAFIILFKSRYLLAFVAFIVLLSSVSTFLYMEQARIIKELFHTREERTQVFANIDLIVQFFSFIIQIFLTSKITQYFGLKWLLSLVGFIVGFGFILLAFTHPSFLPLAIVMSIRRIGEYAFVKPGREMLFVPFGSEIKYKVKNFLDTVVYRGGDALSAQIESTLASIGLTIALLTGACISFIWGILGFYLGKNNTLQSKENDIDS